MAETKPERLHDPEGNALMFGAFLGIAIVGGALWIASTRLHFTGPQLIELCLLTVIAGWLLYEVGSYYIKRPGLIKEMWPQVKPKVHRGKIAEQMQEAHANASIVLGHETDKTVMTWSDEVRSWQSIVTGMTGSGKSTLLELMFQQDIRRGVPIIFFDGKGEKKMLEKILPVIEASGRMDHLRLIDPTQPEKSIAFNPFWAPNGDFDAHVAFIFESFKKVGGDDFFDQHQKVYLQNIARVLYYTGKRFNFNDIMAAAYDEKLMKSLMQIAMNNAKTWPGITRQQRLTLELGIHHLIATFADRDRVSKIQGLLNDLSTYLGDALAMITSPYDNLITMEDVLDKNLILYVSLNININAGAATSLGRILLQNLQLTLGRRYADTGYGVKHQFVSVLLDEFAPFAYANFERILLTARGSNVAFLFALQTYGQLDAIGPGMKEALTSGPNNSFMLQMKDDKTTTQYRKEGGETRQERISMRVEKGGVFAAEKFKEDGSGSRSESYELQLRDDMLKVLPRGQMQVLMSDPKKGLVHKHIHVHRADEHFLMTDLNNLYPRMRTPLQDTEGLNLRLQVSGLFEQAEAKSKGKTKGKVKGK